MSGAEPLDIEAIRVFLKQMGSLDMRFVQKQCNLGNNAMAQLGFVQDACLTGEPDISEHAKGQAAAEVIIEMIADMQKGPPELARFGYLLAEFCVKGRKMEIVGEEIGYSRAHSYRLKDKALEKIHERLVELERNYVQRSECSLKRLELFDEAPNPDSSDDTCSFFKQIVVWIQTKCMACDDCSLAIALA